MPPAIPQRVFSSRLRGRGSPAIGRRTVKTIHAKECILPSEVLPLHWEEASAEVLFRTCADRLDSGAWEEFARRYGVLLGRTVYRVAQTRGTPHRELLDDLVQECYVRICADDGKALRVFRPSHPNADFGYLKVIATHAAVDYFRRKSNDHNTISLDKAPEPEAEDSDPDRAILLQEIDQCLHRVTEGGMRDRDRAVFRLFYLQGLTAKAISQIPAVGLSCEGVESLLGRLRAALRDCVKPRNRQKDHPNERPNEGEAA